LLCPRKKALNFFSIISLSCQQLKWKGYSEKGQSNKEIYPAWKNTSIVLMSLNWKACFFFLSSNYHLHLEKRLLNENGERNVRKQKTWKHDSFARKKQACQIECAAMIKINLLMHFLVKWWYVSWNPDKSKGSNY